MTAFLADADLRDVPLPANTPFRLIGLALGRAESTQLEVLAVEAAGPPSPTKVRSLWKDFNGRRPAPLLVVALHNDTAVLCGPTAAGDEPPVHTAVERGQAERLCREALEQPDRHAAHRYLRDALPAVVDSVMPGVRNEGLLATHELARGARRLDEWNEAGAKARPLLARREEALLKALGFKVEPGDGPTSVLRAGPNGKKLAVAVLLRPDESPDLEADRFSGLSPVSYALTVADREALPYVVVSQATKLRLYPARLNVGVGRRGRTETYVEIHPGHLRAEDAAYLWLLLSADALTEGGTLDKLLEESKRFAGELAVRLRERIYDHVVPQLAQGLAEARKLRKPTAKDLAETYQMAMTVLFRLLFIAYAEDKDLLPYRFNGLYHKRSLKTKAREMVEAYPHGLPANESPFGDGDARWKEVGLLFRAVAEGNREWHVPEYGGGLFSRDADVSPAGALLEKVTLPDTVMGLVLWHLLVIESPEGWGPVDFRSLSVREFGTVYEGLLESELSVAETDLTTDRQGYYRPCQAGEEPEVKKNRIYLHNRSGARKASGTYFTKEFAVDHLLDSALEPALKDHLHRLDVLDETDAAERFFDFRVADIAMGSAHFLVAAVDRIERAFTGYLAARLLTGVHQELARLRESAVKELGDLAEQLEIEDTQLLRRLIARRCIYGVDLNPVAVNLARLSIWVHTFVPGLPLSMLERNLVVGNSLVGVGGISEIEEKAKEDDTPLFKVDAKRLVGDALEPLQRLAHLADATMPQVREARKAMAEAQTAVRPAEALCDILAACRVTGTPFRVDISDWDKRKLSIVGSDRHVEAAAALKSLPPFHFPTAFPEVFLREPPGFDVIIGNPPWEKARVEEHEFWARHFPGLRGLQRAERDRTIAHLKKERPDLLVAWEMERAESEVVRDAVRNMPGMNTGHPDLFRAFMWRFIQLIRPGVGRLGIVLPGDTFKIAGAAVLREKLTDVCGAIAVQMLTNKGEWVFDDVDGRKLIVLVGATAKAQEQTVVSIPPEFHSKGAWDARDPDDHLDWSLEEWKEYSPTLIVPLLPGTDSVHVIKEYLRSPRLGNHPTLRVRRVYADFETTRDRQRYHEEKLASDWKVYTGESFDIWVPDTGRHYAYTNGKEISQALQERRLRSPRGSPYSETPMEWRQRVGTHPARFPRIAFRNVTNRTNRRTFLTALIPGKVVNVEKAPWILWLDPEHEKREEAYLVGVLSSISLDWWARRFVEGQVDQEAFNCLPIPDSESSPHLSKRVVALAGRLAAPDDRFAAWAEAVGVACGPLPEAEKQDHIHELDAVVAHLYGLEEKHLVHIFETFHEGWDYAARLKATLKHFHHWKGKAPVKKKPDAPSLDLRHPALSEARPHFVDNRNGNTLDLALTRHLQALRTDNLFPWGVSIASAFFDVPGFQRVADALEQVGQVRLLLGADPLPEAVRGLPRPGEPREPERTRLRLTEALQQLDTGLRHARDLLPFDAETDQAVRRLLDQLQAGKIEVRRCEDRFLPAKAILFDLEGGGVLAGTSNFSLAGLQEPTGLTLGNYEAPVVNKVADWFNELWDAAAPFDLAGLYGRLLAEYPPYLIYLAVLNELYGDELGEEQHDVGPIPITNFQKHGVWRALRILKEYSGVLIADGVGLGKTFLAGEIIRRYLEDRKRVLLVCPAALRDSTWADFANRFQLFINCVSYEELARDRQFGGDGHALKSNLEEYALVVIDEAHNYRNPDAPARAGVLRQLLLGPRRDLVLLSATPVNNSLWDLYHILRYFVKQDAALADRGVLSLHDRFDEAMKEDPFSLHPDLLFPVIDATTVKRTRQFVKKYYANDLITLPDGRQEKIAFPKPIPSSINYDLDAVLPGFFDRLEQALMPPNGAPELTLARYQPEKYPAGVGGPTPDLPIIGLLRSGLLKRFESSSHAFARTTAKMVREHDLFLDGLARKLVIKKEVMRELSAADDDDEIEELLAEPGATEPLKRYNPAKLRAAVQGDRDLLDELSRQAARVKPENDPKLAALVEELARIAREAEKEGVDAADQRRKHKVLIFSYYDDTVDYVEDYLLKVIAKDKRLAAYRGRVASVAGRESRHGLSRDNAVHGFAPESSNAPPARAREERDRFDLLLSTDVLAEGMNLQECRNIINYDLPWNPMRLVQRHGRIDRIGSPHPRVFLRTFFPDQQLDRLLRLEGRVRRKLAQAAASVGVEDAPIQDGAEREQSFAETREEIERLARGDPTLYERGGTAGAAQSGEEYRQELRRALEQEPWKSRLGYLPWKAGSGMVKGTRRGHFFCARIGERIYLRFAPADGGEIVHEIGTCLRLIECAPETERVVPEDLQQGAFASWQRARQDIFAAWKKETDPRNLQPRVSKLNREIADFLRKNPPKGVEQGRLERCIEALEAPCSRREENLLRAAFQQEHPGHGAKGRAVVEEVERIGLEPFRAPAPLPPIRADEVHLVCWMAIESGTGA